MSWEAAMYDGDGNEIVMKPGHMMVIGKNAMYQVKITELEIPEGTVCEYGSAFPCDWITSATTPLVKGEHPG